MADSLLDEVDEDPMSMDMDSLLGLLDGNQDPMESRQGDFQLETVQSELASQFGANDNLLLQRGFFEPKMSSSPVGSDVSFDSAGNSAVFHSTYMEHSDMGQIGILQNPSSYNAQDTLSQNQFELPNGNSEYSISGGDNAFTFSQLMGGQEFPATLSGGFLQNGWEQNSYMNQEPYAGQSINNFQNMGEQDIGRNCIISSLFDDQPAEMQQLLDTDDCSGPVGQYLPEFLNLTATCNNDETMAKTDELSVQKTRLNLQLQDAQSNGFNVNNNSHLHVLPSKIRLGQRIDSKISSTKHLLKMRSRKKGFIIKNEKSDDPFSSNKFYNRRLSSFSSRIHPVKDECKRNVVPPSTLQMACLEEEIKSKFPDSKTASTLIISHKPVENITQIPGYDVNDDYDICVLENLSQPARNNLSITNEKAIVTVQTNSFSSGSPNKGLVASGGAKIKTASDERHIFRVALQDLSQPKSESLPPEGLLAVPLLRHQRIALSWMVQMETTSLLCSGGILADDQGLGKTVSTIALILKERSPSPKIASAIVKENVTETLNLDDEDDVTAPELKVVKEDPESGKTEAKVGDSIKGRPAAGTLVVCPTSVIRQWAEELRTKVTNQANLTVLTYHGGNRTKDPLELTKYDVVLTTYSIVSMEVPKQPLVDEDDRESGKKSFMPSKKRKYPPTSDKRCKGKKGNKKEISEAEARPLARVGWFRVVLDEAQSIKNHKTQVARACWGLRAKRRWCLSGTPIQNAVDDLYSYFRFLRYDPYAVYTRFCSTIKAPIQRNPTGGYKKLQAVLKTIMLRRTKATLLDGEPIINLPPKNIELKKVDFTLEEREFYCRLEADSRAQFAEYAAAGTVKQNYVNILLMLLRLRQACDHPFLVKGCKNTSAWRSSVEMAKQLPRQQQLSLLNCLEDSLAICGICNDPPEDAVVTSCKHVFCNQCILEHLNGDDDDKQCPTTNCNAHLTKSHSIFSRTALKSSLIDQPGQESIKTESSPVKAEPIESCSSSESFKSSKIRAALEVLKSISTPRQSCLTENISEVKDSPPPTGEKAIVFSQWTGMLDLLEDCLKTSLIQYRRLDGTMTVHARDKAVRDFNTLPEVSVMIMSLKAASLGLNMVAACHVLLLDLWWNPTTEDQAIDRAHRIGQTRPVSVLRLTVKDTVEDRILALQQKKREMVSSAFGEDETGSCQTRLTVEDLNYLFMA
jgi:SNF2 family DNA or RNA helicase